MYRPKQIDELRTPVHLLIPTYTTYNGVEKPAYPQTGVLIYCNFKSYGGTETAVNGVISVIDTALVVTWYRPDIIGDCRIKLENGAVYNIISEPENVEMQNKYLSFKVERVKGK